MLVGEAQRQAVGASLGENVLKRCGEVQVVVDLIDVTGGVRALLWFQRGSRERGLPYPCE